MQPAGPGYPFHANTDFIGPIPSDAFWIIELTSNETLEAELLIQTKPIDFAFPGSCVTRIGQHQELAKFHEGSRIGANSFVPANLRVTLTSPTIGDIETRQQGQLWDPVGQLYQLVEPAGGGLTPEQDANLTIAAVGVTAAFPINVSGLIRSIPLAQLVTHLPINLLVKAADSVVISGTGSLDRPIGINPVSAYGATWTFITVPEHFGRTPGPTIEYQPRMLQLNIIRFDAGSDQFVSETNDYHIDGIWIQWGLNFPSRIDYQVAPGVVALWQWLELP